MSLNKIEGYFKTYDKQVYQVFTQQGAEPNMAEVAVFESRIGFSLPAEFREFSVHPLGGMYMAVKEELWPRARAYDVGEFWSFLYGLMVYSLSPKAPDWLQMKIAWQRMSDEGYPQFVPFLKIIGDPDPYCFTRDERIIRWRHETPDEPEEVPQSFSQVLMLEIRELGKRTERKISHRSV